MDYQTIHLNFTGLFDDGTQDVIFSPGINLSEGDKVFTIKLFGGYFTFYCDD